MKQECNNNECEAEVNLVIEESAINAQSPEHLVPEMQVFAHEDEPMPQIIAIEELGNYDVGHFAAQEDIMEAPDETTAEVEIEPPEIESPNFDRTPKEFVFSMQQRHRNSAQSKKTHNTEKQAPRPYMCGFCGVSFEQPALLVNHVQTMHSDELGRPAEIDNKSK